MGRKSLKEYSNIELAEILENNENQDLHELAGFCSEILRRMFVYRNPLDKNEPKQASLEASSDPYD